MQTMAKQTIRAAALALLALLASAPLANAQIDGRILTKDKKVVAGKIRWFPAKRVMILQSHFLDYLCLNYSLEHLTP